MQIVKNLRPSVVHIGTRSVAITMSTQDVPEGVGTGIVLDDRGHILTNNHVVEGAQQMVVTLHTDESFLAELVGRDPPGGPTVSKGVISALVRTLPDPESQTTMVDMIQTDSLINPGNSGGPLVNDRAEVIGMNTAIIQGSEGIGFAISIDGAKEVAAQLIEHGAVRRGYVGVLPFNITPAIAAQNDFPVRQGIYLVEVIPGAAAIPTGRYWLPPIAESSHRTKDIRPERA